MNAAHDIFAETNPAFCAYALAEFTKAYSTIQPEGPETPVAYLALPVALSGEFTVSFTGTNKNTGLLEWLERTPQVQVRLADRLNGSLPIVSDAIRFGCFARILTMGDGARLRPGDRRLKATTIRTLGDESAQVIKHAGRLGYWFANAGSTSTAFSMMGLTV